MTFSAIEASRQKGEPVTLYLFVYGGEEGDSPAPAHFAYTDAERAITDADSGITYVPIPIMRDNVVSSGTLDRSALSVRMPKDAPLAELFRVYPPTQVVTLIIRQGHLSDSDGQFLVVWSGRVLSVGREDHECVVSCEPVSSSLRRPGLRRHYQLGCPHVLYGPQCRANRAAATVSATVSSVSGTSVTLAAGWEGGFPPSKFTEGILEWTNSEGGTEKRKILSVSGNTLLIGGLLRDLAASDTVNVILGCNHQHGATDSVGDCKNLHDNIQNFGGCPWIPTVNPIGFRNQYY